MRFVVQCWQMQSCCVILQCSSLFLGTPRTFEVDSNFRGRTSQKDALLSNMTAFTRIQSRTCGKGYELLRKCSAAGLLLFFMPQKWSKFAFCAQHCVRGICFSTCFFAVCNSEGVERCHAALLCIGPAASCAVCMLRTFAFHRETVWQSRSNYGSCSSLRRSTLRGYRHRPSRGRSHTQL